MFEKIYRPALLIILALILIIQATGLIMDLSKSAKCSEKAILVAEQIETMSTSYNDDVYDNPLVDNINQQQFVQNEYQLLTQQAIAELLAACK